MKNLKFIIITQEIKIKPAQLPLESNDMIVDVQLVTISD